MPVYEYKGVNATGKMIKGIIDAENPQAARGRLRKDDIYLTDLTEGVRGGEAQRRQIGIGRSVKSQDIAIMTRQLATLVGSGIPLVESLSALVDQIENIRLKRVISEVRERVNEGLALADAMRQHPRIFSSLYANMVMAGESSGALDLVLDRLADFTEGQMKLKNKLVSVMAYPVIMLLIGLAVMIILFTFVIPKVTSIYDSMDAVLPLPTIILISSSEYLTSYWYIVLAGAFFVFYLFKAWTSREKGQYRWHRMVLRTPLFGGLVRMMAVSRFSRTLGTLLASGVPLLTALDIVKNVVNNKVISQAVESARVQISEGESISDPLRKSGHFPAMVTHMIAVGEKTGALEKMLLKVSDTYDDMVDSRITALTSLLEPIMIVVMAVTVGFIVVAVMLPLLELTSKINI